MNSSDRNIKWFKKHSTKRRIEKFNKRKEEIVGAHDPIVYIEIPELNKEETSATFNLDTFEWKWTVRAKNLAEFKELSNYLRDRYIPLIVQHYNKIK